MTAVEYAQREIIDFTHPGEIVVDVRQSGRLSCVIVCADGKSYEAHGKWAADMIRLLEVAG